MTQSAAIDHIIDLEKELHKPAVRSDQKVLKQLLAKDFMEFGSSGNIYKREDTLRALPTQSPRTVFSKNYQGICLAQDTIHLTYCSSPSENFKSGSLRSSIWKNIDGIWQMWFHQGTKFQQ